MSLKISVKRVNKLRKRLIKKKVENYLVKNIKNVQYLTGFTGSYAWILINQKKAFFITDSRYIEQAGYEINNFTIVSERDSFKTTFLSLCKDLSLKRVHYSAKSMNVKELLSLNEEINKLSMNIKLVATVDIVSKLRKYKDEQEIILIKKSISIAEKALNSMLAIIKPGISERDIAIDLEYRIKKLGADNIAFDFIVASGERSSMPHGIASTKKIKNHEILLIDFGALYKGYHSDITRCFFIGSVSEKQKAIYNIVLNAQNEAINKIKDKIEAKLADKIARNYIDNAGYGNYFGHSLGHGIGLDIHEAPFVSINSSDILKNGMVFTIEPGIYLEQEFGIRIEDDVTITENGIDVLSSISKSIMVI